MCIYAHKMRVYDSCVCQCATQDPANLCAEKFGTGRIILDEGLLNTNELVETFGTDGVLEGIREAFPFIYAADGWRICTGDETFDSSVPSTLRSPAHKPLL